MASATWQVGIDLGTTYTAAAVHREGRVEVVWLGERTAVIPSVVFVKDDSTVLTGEAANRQGLVEPERAAREFKRRIGDPTPLIVGRQPFSADLLTAHLLRDVVARIAEREGGQPGAICLTHPANWGPYKLDLLKQAVDQAGLGDRMVTYIAEPQAAAIHYATQERMELGAVVAVYDLGGGTFDAALIRRTTDDFEIIGRPQGVERLGGIDFDTAVLTHADSVVDGAISSLEVDDDEVAAAVARLKAECTDAKEVLSSDTETTITVSLPNLRHTVRLTRAELEGMIRGPISESVEAMRRALTSAGVAPEQLQAVLLVGGSSRIPLISQVISSDLGRPVAVDAHPKHAVAMGAALAAARAAGGGGADAVTVVTTEEDENPGRLAAPVSPVIPVGPSPGVEGRAHSKAGPATENIAATEAVPAGNGDPTATAPVSAGPGSQTHGPLPRPDGAEPDAQLVAKPGVAGGRSPWLIPVAAVAAILLLGLIFVTTQLGGGGDGDGTDPIVAGDDPGAEVRDGAPDEPLVDDPLVAPDGEPQTFPVDKTVWWGGFEITVEEATFTSFGSGWDVEVALGLENQYPGNNTLGGEASLAMGELATAEGLYTDQPQLPGGGRNRDTLTFSVSADAASEGSSEPAIDDAVLTFGAAGTNQAVVPLGAGDVETFVLTPFQVDQTLATSGDSVEFTFKEGIVDASYWAGEEGTYHVWMKMDLEYLGDFAGGHYTDPTMFSLEAPSGESVTGGPTGTGGVNEFVAEALGRGRPVQNLWLSFKIPSPGSGRYTVKYDHDDKGDVTGEISFELEDVDFS